MLKATELRIGNWVFNIFNRPVQVTVIDKTLGWASPIPLTPEILENIGFENRRIEGFNELDGTWWLMPEEMKFRFLFEYDKAKGEFYYNFLGIRILSIHQLQNLYFALTGHELEITL